MMNPRFLAVVVVAACLSTTALAAPVTVFSPGQGGYNCIRIPSIVLAPNNTLVAFAEGRHWTGDGCVPSSSEVSVGRGPTDIVSKVSFDMGETWSALTTVVESASQPTAVTDELRGTVVLNYLGADGTSYQVTSTTNGLSWGKPQDLSSFLGPNDGAEVGPGVGLQLSKTNPVAPGRLLFIGHEGAYVKDAVWYTDDGGKTYNVSTTLFPKMDEAQLVELANGSVMANMRNNHLTDCKCRGIAVSNDGGHSFSPISFAPQLVSPVCMASIVSSWDVATLYFSNPNTQSGRVNGTIKYSTDSGASWNDLVSVTDDTTGFAYSCLTRLPPSLKRVGLLYETDMQGCSGPSCQSVFDSFATA